MKRLESGVKIKMKIGIDLDGVIADFVSGFLKFYNLKFNENILFENWQSYHFYDNLRKTKEEEIKLIDEFYNSNFFDDINLIDGAKKGVERLTIDNKVSIITARPIEYKEKTENFFKKNFSMNNWDIFYSEKPKGVEIDKKSICKKLGIELMIEDSQDYARGCADEGIKVLLFNQPWNKNSREYENVNRVYNWKEVFREYKG